MSSRGEDGRDRRASSRRAILATTASLLSEKGYADLTIDEVCARSGVAKTTIYRHFPGKAELILGVVLDAFGPLAASTLDDSAELRTVIEHLATVLGDPLIRQAVMVVFAEAPRHPELLRQLRTEFIDPERKRITDQAVSLQGQWPTRIDPSIAFDVVGGALLFRLSLGEGAVDEAFIDGLVSLVQTDSHDANHPGGKEDRLAR
jgi:AcrR family transcriptional regulator